MILLIAHLCASNDAWYLRFVYPYPIEKYLSGVGPILVDTLHQFM